MLIFALLFALFAATPAFAECASGYHQITVPLCQQIPSCPVTVGANQMGILAPCSPSVITANQITTPALIDIGITDANATVPAGSVPISVKAPGSANVEVWTHGVMATRLTPGANGMFTGTLNLSSEPAGPLHVMFNAWDVAPGATPTVHLQGEYTLFVNGTRPAIPTPPPANGMTLVFSDHFTTLSATPCKPGTGTWPNCTAPSASDGFKWYENLFNGLDFGDCANEHTDGTHNPFTILPQGGLRIRNTYSSTYIDPYGLGRTQYCGVLSTGFRNGTTSLPAGTNGYYDARILVPNGACGAPGNNTCSGGSWPSFWMLPIGNAGGPTEIDETEQYGNDPNYDQVSLHGTGGAFIYNAYPLTGVTTDLTWDFHTYGVLITGAGTSSAQVCAYFDERQLRCIPMPSTVASNPWSLMLELASGGGWVENPPLSNQYDMFVDWVGVWH